MSSSNFQPLLKPCTDHSPDCIVALFPVEDATDGSLSYDVSRYLGIQSVGFGIAHYCIEALGIPGLQGTGTGGIDSTGKIVVPKNQEPAHPLHKGITINSGSSLTRHNPRSQTTP